MKMSNERNRGTTPVRTSDKPSSNSATFFTKESNSTFSEGGRKTAVKFILSLTNLSKSTDKPVTCTQYCLQSAWNFLSQLRRR